MTTENWIALLTAGLSFLVAVAGFFVTRKNQKDVEILKADLSERTAAHGARLEYEFEARKRLYHACAPLLFQLSELAERAESRIFNLAGSAAGGNLEPGNSWLSRRYYALSTYYWLLAPLAIGKLLQRRLTQLDLSLDRAAHWQYALLKQLTSTFSDDFDLAGKDDGEITIPEEDWITGYDPHNGNAETLRVQDPVRYWQQGIPRGILENAFAALVTRDADGTERVMDFREFQDAYEDENDSAGVRAPFDRIGYLFDGFHPRSRPILWRALMAQLYLYRAILDTRYSDRLDPDLWTRLMDTKAYPVPDWRSAAEKETVPDNTIQAAARIGAAYALQTTSPILAALTAEDNKGGPATHA